MIGDFQIEGGDLKGRTDLNLQDITIIVGDDTGICNRVLREIDSYFNNRTEREKAVSIRCNGDQVGTDAFDVLYLTPWMNVNELVKITKRSLLGNYLESLYSTIDETVKLRVFLEMESILINEINKQCKEIGLHCNIDDMSFSAVDKLLQWEYENGKSVEEISLYDVKKLAIRLFARQTSKKRKLMIVDFPEYGITSQEYRELLALIDDSKNSIDNCIIYTRREAVRDIWSSIYQYHFIFEDKIHGLEDFDEICYDIQTHFGKNSKDNIQVERFHRSLFREEEFRNTYHFLVDTYFSIDK